MKRIKMLVLFASLFSSQTFASPSTIYLDGSYQTQADFQTLTQHPYSAQISYDTSTPFGPYGSGSSLVAGDQFIRTANLGSISIFANGQTDTSTIYSMIVSKNYDSGQPGSIFSLPTHLYSANIIFYSPNYIFNIASSVSPVPFTWTNDLLPSALDPVPFSALGTTPSFNLQAQTVLMSFTVNSYSLIAPTSVPVPAAVWLFGSGLIGLLSFNRRKNKTANHRRIGV